MSKFRREDFVVQSLAPRQVAQTTFTQTNLISDGSVPAERTDPNLINPWGVAYSPTSPFWISDNGTGLTSIDSVAAGGVMLNVRPAVTIAPAARGGDQAAPTGQVFQRVPDIRRIHVAGRYACHVSVHHRGWHHIRLEQRRG